MPRITLSDKPFAVGAFIREYWSGLLILLVIIGFISKSLYNIPFSLMALLGLCRAIKAPERLWADPFQRHYSWLFLCLWLPLLCALPDAENIPRAARTVFPYLRFLFAGLFIIQELSRHRRRIEFVLAGVFFIVLFWCVDASLQFFLGRNILGYPYRGGDITGMFYPRNTISHICAVLSGLCFFYILRHSAKTRVVWLALAPLFFVVLLSGRRAAWIMLALSATAFVVYACLAARNKRTMLTYAALASLCLGALLSLTILFHAPTNAHFNRTLGLFSGDYETMDIATSRRLPLWQTALTAFKLNPLNGIGPRGYRYVYQDYSSTHDYWLSQTHPHLQILEIMAETGLIGLGGYFLFLYLLLRGFMRRKNRAAEFPFLLPVLVALFPLNAHMAFYGSIWTSVSWWLIAFYCACLSAGCREDTDH